MNMIDEHENTPWATPRLLGAILWPSFFAAGVANAAFFSFVDPIELGHITFPHWDVSRSMGYTIGFLAFWSATASASAFTWLLLRPGRRFNRPMR
jgi:hypothetical protein